jgi:endo-1,4-beta-D-glucanase Y
MKHTNKMRKYSCVLIAATLLAGGLTAQNPIITDQFTADPTARVFEGKVYVFPSHDIPSPIERLKTWFCMADYHVFSSDNLTEWTDHGVIVSQDKAPWVDATSFSMWAPDCVERDGKYYFYFPATVKDTTLYGRGSMVGVAIADKPYGPYTPLPEPIKGVHGIDPCTLVDADGQAYIYWAGMGELMGAKLKDNMTELASEPVAITRLPARDKGLKEGPFVFKRNGKYYFTFPWVENQTEALFYAIGDNPLGPFEMKGRIMDESPVGCWTNHHSIIEYKGQWYLFYHHNDLSPSFDKNRSMRIDSLSFNTDGTIRKVVPTLRGVGLTDATKKIQLDRFSHLSATGAVIDFINPSGTFGGWKTILSESGAWVQYNKVDFGSGQLKTATALTSSPTGGKVTVRIDSPQGKIIAELTAPHGEGWTQASAPLTNVTAGVHDLYVSASGGKVEIDWIRFAAENAQPLSPWESGAFETQKYRNVFAEAGYSQEEIDAQLSAIFRQIFEGADKVYFEVEDSLAYISDIKNNDVRTEGMSYGLMIAVQFDRKDIFDRLWRWSRKYMQHHEGDHEGYFAWSCHTDGTRNAQGPASDGELYFVTSLIFASNRWGNDTGINYLKEAQYILDCAMSKDGSGGVTNFINMEHKLITFVPSVTGGAFTDPSYHLPAFYEVWARWAGDGRAELWRECASRSREYLHKAVHPQTGLTPDYSEYDGSPKSTSWLIGDAFRFDSWRVPLNIALDYSWACADKEWQQNYAHTIQNFLYRQGPSTFADQYNIDGTTPEQILPAGGFTTLRHSLGLVATSAASSSVCTHPKSREFLENFLNAAHAPYEDGYFDAYYDGLLRLFSFMHLSGRYRIIFPEQANTTPKK